MTTIVLNNRAPEQTIEVQGEMALFNPQPNLNLFHMTPPVVNNRPSIIMSCPNDCLIQLSDTEWMYGSEIYQMVQDTKALKRFTIQQMIERHVGSSDVQNIILDYIEHVAPDFPTPTAIGHDSVLNINVSKKSSGSAMSFM
jgi:hypothetical protein